MPPAADLGSGFADLVAGLISFYSGEVPVCLFYYRYSIYTTPLFQLHLWYHLLIIGEQGLYHPIFGKYNYQKSY